MLEQAGADLLEISGGSYESPAMAGVDADGRELVTEHESPFWNSAAAVSAATTVPVMLTGGFRTRAEVDLALGSGVCDMVGVGRPLAVRPGLAGRFVRGETDVLDRARAAARAARRPRAGCSAPRRAPAGTASSSRGRRTGGRRCGASPRCSRRSTTRWSTASRPSARAAPGCALAQD